MKIKEKLRAFGILVIRMIWPGKGRKGIQHLGILILGLGAMIGVSQAGTIGKLVSGAVFGQTDSASQLVSKVAKPDSTSSSDLATQTSAAAEVNADAPSAGAPNIVDLVGDSELILHGMVKEVSDGFENGVPYTQVTVRVKESLRGKVGDEYTFRQFGLIQPRKMGNGKVNLNVTPAGWAKYRPDENVVLFLYNKASITGLRTTVGLGQGKIGLNGGNAQSDLGNKGLFKNVEADQTLLNDSDKRLLSTERGPVNAESFLSFVRKAVGKNWVEGGKLRHAKK